MVKTSSGGPSPPWSISSLPWTHCWPRWRLGVGSSNSRSRGEGRFSGEFRRKLCFLNGKNVEHMLQMCFFRWQIMIKTVLFIYIKAGAQLTSKWKKVGPMNQKLYSKWLEILKIMFGTPVWQVEWRNNDANPQIYQKKLNQQKTKCVSRCGSSLSSCYIA
jgi:hypothetical protein